MKTYTFIKIILGSMALTFGLMGFYTHSYEILEWNKESIPMLVMLGITLLILWVTAIYKRIYLSIATGATIGILLTMQAFPSMDAMEDLVVSWNWLGGVFCVLGAFVLIPTIISRISFKV